MFSLSIKKKNLNPNFQFGNNYDQVVFFFFFEVVELKKVKTNNRTLMPILNNIQKS